MLEHHCLFKGQNLSWKGEEVVQGQRQRITAGRIECLESCGSVQSGDTGVNLHLAFKMLSRLSNSGVEAMAIPNQLLQPKSWNDIANHSPWKDLATCLQYRCNGRGDGSSKTVCIPRTDFFAEKIRSVFGKLLCRLSNKPSPPWWFSWPNSGSSFSQITCCRMLGCTLAFRQWLLKCSC